MLFGLLGASVVLGVHALNTIVSFGRKPVLPIHSHVLSTTDGRKSLASGAPLFS